MQSVATYTASLPAFCWTEANGRPTYFYQLLLPLSTSWLATSRLRMKCDSTRTETRFRLSAKRTSPFKSAGESVHSTAGSRGVRISGSNAGYTMFRGSVKSTGHPLAFASFSFTSRPVASPCAVTFQLDSQVCWIARPLQNDDYTTVFLSLVFLGSGRIILRALSSVGPFISFCCPYNKDSWALSQMLSLARVHVLQTFVSATSAWLNVLVKLSALRFRALRFSARRYSWSSSVPVGHWLVTWDARCAKYFINFTVKLNKTFISLLLHRYAVF